jgi:3'-5' exoribonuclease
MVMNGDDTAYPPIAVKDLKPGDHVVRFFELRSKEARKTRAGDTYLDISAGDATASISGKIWPDSIRKWGLNFEPGDFVKIEGRVESYREKNQLVVEKIRIALADEIGDLKDLVRSTVEHPDSLFQELVRIAGTIEIEELAQFVTAILERHEEALKTFPAAKMVHHAYKGGLIEHTVAVSRKVDAIAATDKAINRDIAIAGAMLHDIGKLRELNPTRMGRTFEGRLIGHLVLGVETIFEVAYDMKLLDRQWFREVEHIVISHHGEVQFGSPIAPMTREALVVHFVDNLDSRLKIVEEALESVEPDGFSPYNRWLEGRAFAGSPANPKEE